MKRISLFVLMGVFGVVPAAGWVLLNDIQTTAKGQLLPKLVSGKPVRVCVDVLQEKESRQYRQRRWEDEVYTGEKQREYYELSQKIITQSLEEWFSTLDTQIRKQNRADEFVDILALIYRRGDLRFVNRGTFKPCDEYALEDIDLKVRATLYSIRSHATGVGVRSSYTFYLQPDERGAGLRYRTQGGDQSYVISLHELGHVLGLGDMYVEGMDRGYLSEHNSKVYTVGHFMKLPKISSIMNMSNGESALTCDDLDGLVNDMDVQLAAKLKDSPRRTQGWLSLCQSRKMAYAYGVPFMVTDEQITAQQEFVRNKRQGASPLAAQVVQAAAVSAKEDRRVAQELIDKDTLAIRQQQADSTANAAAVVKSVADQLYEEKVQKLHEQEAKHICPVCDKQVVNNGTWYRLSKDSEEGIFLHKECRDKIATGVSSKTGRPVISSTVLKGFDKKYRQKKY